MRIIAIALLIPLSCAVAVAGAVAQTAPPAAQPQIDFDYRQRTEERLAAMDRQFRNLTGTMERQSFELRRANAKIKALEAEIAALKKSVEALEAAPPPPVAPIGGVADSTDQAGETPSDATRAGADLPVGAPQEDYDAAFGLLKESKFEAGETAFRAFLDRHPQHVLASNARYWIGETLYARQRYQESAQAFLEAWQSDVDGPKAPDNLLKLGMSLSRLEKDREACVSFGKLLSDYGGAPERIRSAARRERESLKC